MIKAEKIEYKNGVLIVDDKPIDTLDKLLYFLSSNFSKEYATQSFYEAYLTYKTDPESVAKAKEELRNFNLKIK